VIKNQSLFDNQMKAAQLTNLQAYLLRASTSGCLDVFSDGVVGQQMTYNEPALFSFHSVGWKQWDGIIQSCSIAATQPSALLFCRLAFVCSFASFYNVPCCANRHGTHATHL